jgi:siroheme synthase
MMMLSLFDDAAALLSLGGARTSRLHPAAFFHHCPSSSARSKASQLQSSSNNDNPSRTTTSTDESSSLREAIESLVSLIGPSSSEDNLVKPPPSEKNTHHPSIVHIIGTGLTPNLLSLPLTTLHLLSQADAVLYDSLGLAHEDICRVVPQHCEVICVGKRGDSQKSWKQSDIDDLILQMAMTTTTTTTQTASSSCSSSLSTTTTDGSSTTIIKPKTILRLKGGDPFLFGRARTEIDTLKSNNIPYSYTPAISSCIAGPHLGGIPLTDPTLNCQSFGVWSGTDAFGRSRGLIEDNKNDDNNATSDIDNTSGNWEGLGVDTLVFLMIGRLDKLEALCNLLVSRGEKWDESTPCAVIQNAGGKRSMVQETTDDSQDSSQIIQRVWRGTLGSIVPVIRKEDETRTSVSPAVFIVGATCQLDFLSY